MSKIYKHFETIYDETIITFHENVGSNEMISYYQYITKKFLILIYITEWAFWNDSIEIYYKKI